MRLIPVNSVNDGSFLAKTIFDNEGRILLREGVKLTGNLLRRIQSIGIYTLYINDEYSNNIIDDVIEPHIRQQAVRGIKDTFFGIEKFTQSSNSGSLSASRQKALIHQKQEYFQSINAIAKDIVEEMLTKKNLMINLVDIKSVDNYTYQHSVNVAVLSLILGIKLKLSKYELYNLCTGAILHDVGKVFIPDEILLKNDKLTNQEFEIVKQHTTKGYEYLKTISEIPPTARIISLQHHEKPNGTGYPEQRRSPDINKLSLITAIADVYDALTSDRSYRRALSPNEALEYIMAGGGTQFDYEMVKVFANTIVPYPEGSLIRMKSGDIAVVEGINENFPLRPKIKIIKSENPSLINAQIDLLKELGMVIEGIQYAMEEK